MDTTRDTTEEKKEDRSTENQDNSGEEGNSGREDSGVRNGESANNGGDSRPEGQPGDGSRREGSASRRGEDGEARGNMNHNGKDGGHGENMHNSGGEGSGYREDTQNSGDQNGNRRESGRREEGGARRNTDSEGGDGRGFGEGRRRLGRVSDRNGVADRRNGNQYSGNQNDGGGRGRNTNGSRTHRITTLDEIRQVLNNPRVFCTTYDEDLKNLTDGYGYLLGFDNEEQHDADQIMTMYALIPDDVTLTRYAKYYRTTSERLIKERSRRGSDGVCTIDIVKDVINVTCARWVCEMIAGIDENTAAEVFENLSHIHTFIFRDIDAHPDCNKLRGIALKASEDLRSGIKKELRDVFKPRSEGIVDDVTRIAQEMKTSGFPVKTHSAYSFHQRLLKASKSIARLPDMNMGSTSDDEERRIIANVLGLCIMASVSYAQVCARAVDFFLDEEHDEERNNIIHMLTSTVADTDINNQIMAFIRKSQKLLDSPKLFRIVAQDSHPFKKGDRVLADFRSAHVDFGPIDCQRSLQGLGLHRCPGLMFVEKTMPEIFKNILRLKNLQRADGKLTLRNIHPDDNCGEIFVPESLVLKYDRETEPEQKTYKPSKLKLPAWHNLMDNVLRAISLFLVLLPFIWYCVSMLDCPSFLCTPASPHNVSSPQLEAVSCKPPTTIFQPWEIKTIVLGPKGKPIPVTHISNLQKPHQLSIVDIDARDMQLQVFIRGVLNTSTTDFELDKSVHCGEDERKCLNNGFSRATIVIPPGMHTVEVTWAGKEFLPGTNETNWGKDRSRRFKWMREYCA